MLDAGRRGDGTLVVEQPPMTSDRPSSVVKAVTCQSVAPGVSQLASGACSLRHTSRWP